MNKKLENSLREIINQRKAENRALKKLLASLEIQQLKTNEKSNKQNSNKNKLV